MCFLYNLRFCFFSWFNVRSPFRFRFSEIVVDTNKTICFELCSVLGCRTSWLKFYSNESIRIYNVSTFKWIVNDPCRSGPPTTSVDEQKKIETKTYILKGVTRPVDLNLMFPQMKQKLTRSEHNQSNAVISCRQCKVTKKLWVLCRKKSLTAEKMRVKENHFNSI